MYWIRKYRDAGELTELTRRDVVTFLDRVEVKDANHVKIYFRFGDEYKSVLRKYKRQKKTDTKAMESVELSCEDELEVVNG